MPVDTLQFNIRGSEVEIVLYGPDGKEVSLDGDVTLKVVKGRATVKVDAIGLGIKEAFQGAWEEVHPGVPLPGSKEELEALRPTLRKDWERILGPNHPSLKEGALA